MLRFPGLRPAAEFPIGGRFLELPLHLEWDKEKSLLSSAGSPRLSLSESVTFIIFGRLNLKSSRSRGLVHAPGSPCTIWFFIFPTAAGGAIIPYYCLA